MHKTYQENGVTNDPEIMRKKWTKEEAFFLCPFRKKDEKVPGRKKNCISSHESWTPEPEPHEHWENDTSCFRFQRHFEGSAFGNKVGFPSQDSRGEFAPQRSRKTRYPCLVRVGGPTKGAR